MALGRSAVGLAVMIIDIRRSVQRSDVRANLRRLMEDLQSAAPGAFLQIAWGDEIEGILPVPTDLWEIYVRARRSLGDVPFYMGVGFGDVAEDPLPSAPVSVHEINGTAFKAARWALERAKGPNLTSIALAFQVFGDASLTVALNGYPLMLNVGIGQMTPKQRLYFDDLVLGCSHTAIAVRHGVRQPTVSKALRMAGADQLVCMREGLGALLTFVADHVKWGTQGQETTS